MQQDSAVEAASMTQRGASTSDEKVGGIDDCILFAWIPIAVDQTSAEEKSTILTRALALAQKAEREGWKFPFITVKLILRSSNALRTSVPAFH